jgi:hypothetical protein
MFYSFVYQKHLGDKTAEIITGKEGVYNWSRRLNGSGSEQL